MPRAARQIPLFPDAPESGELPDFAVRKSGRAKRLSIKVYPRGRVEVVVPKRARARDVQSFVEEHRDWIEKTRAAYAEEHPPEPVRLPTRIPLPAIERHYGVVYEPRDAAAGVRFRETGSIVRLAGRTDELAACTTALKRWLAGVARQHFGPRLADLSLATGNRYERMHVRGQKTCWGSHSSSGTISINYCLLFLSPELVRYLMIHELCHAKHMNHSRRFWNHVARFEPDYRRLDSELSDAWKAIPAWVGIY